MNKPERIQTPGGSDIDSLMEELREELKGKVSSKEQDDALVDHTPERLTIDELMKRVDVELRRLRGQDASPQKLAPELSRPPQQLFDLPTGPMPPVLELSSKTHPSTLGELFALEDFEFVLGAYRLVLGREPDDSGFSVRLDKLRRGGLSKTELIGQLSYSPEGRLRGKQFPGFKLRYLVRRFFRVPVVGNVAAWCYYLARLPRLARSVQEGDALIHRALQEQSQQVASLSRAVGGGLSHLADGVRRDGQALVRYLDSLDEYARFQKSSSIALHALLSKVLLDQGELTRSVTLVRAQIESTVAKEELAGTVQAVNHRLAGLEGSRDKAQSSISEIQSLTQKVAAEVASMAALAATKAEAAQVEGLMAQLQSLAAATNATGAVLERMSVEAQASRARVDEVEAAIGSAVARSASKDDISQIEVRLERDYAARHRVEGLAEVVSGLTLQVSAKADATEAKAAVQSLAERVDTVSSESVRRADLEETKEALENTHQAREKQREAAAEEALVAMRRQLLDHRRNVLDQERRLNLLLEEARRRMPEPMGPDQIAALAAEADHTLDAFYVSFEDQFRGTREDIKGRVAVYLPLVQAAKAGLPDRPILDLGCGRGEWLELLKDHGLVGRGVDANRVMVAQCRELALDVVEGDVGGVLRGLPPKSLGALTGFHIVEHLPFRTVVALFDEALRVLMPGGFVLFETPNPENIIVGACNFYFDPTHRNPIPPEALRFVAEMRGFVRSEIMRLHPPHWAEDSAEVDGLSPRFKAAMTAAQDYSVIGFKA